MNIARNRDPSVGVWLITCAAWVWALIVLGGITRLTRSGLSIPRWDPLSGAIPPLGREGWARAFAQYRQTPEYRLVNDGMTLGAFQEIYYVEFIHRAIARAAGLVFAVPLAYYAWRRKLAGRRARLAAIGALGALQGLAGWWMVASGLNDAPHVSPYRLAFHLLIALGLFTLLLWAGLDEWKPAGLVAERSDARSARWATLALLVASIATISWGAVTAGLHAGLVCNTFPTMNGAWIPVELQSARWAFDDWTKNPVGVQFVHRLLAGLTAIAAIAAASLTWKCGGLDARLWALCLLLAIIVQITLGALTVVGSVPLSLASLHQAHAVVLLAVECGMLRALVPALEGRWKLLAVLAVVATASACTRSRQEASGKADPSRGARDVFTARCSVCHGMSGRGDGLGAAAMTPKPRDYTDKAWQRSVSDDDLRRVILYGGASVGKSAAMPASFDLQSDSSVVEALVQRVRAFGN